VDYLFRITVEKKWYISNKPTPLYVIATSKENAIELARKHMKDGYSVKSVQKLAKKISGIMFHGK